MTCYEEAALVDGVCRGSRQVATRSSVESLVTMIDDEMEVEGASEAALHLSSSSGLSVVGARRHVAAGPLATARSFKRLRSGEPGEDRGSWIVMLRSLDLLHRLHRL